MRTLSFVCILVLVACTGDATLRGPFGGSSAAGVGDAGPVVRGTDGGDAAVADGGVATADAGPTDPPDAGPTDPPDAGPELVDDAEIVSDTFPPQLTVGATRTVVIAVRNTGTTTWTRALGYRLGAVGDSDPLATDTRWDLEPGETVAPGETRDFAVALRAPASARTVVTDWQMLREQVRWFGATARHDVEIVEATPPPAFDLSNVTIVGSPDVRGFPVTSQITALTFSPGTIHVDHTLRGQWPPVTIDPSNGTTQEATIWVFFAINGTWYATGGERLRPSQTDKSLANPSILGPDWLYDPNRWGPMTNYVPQPGELVGFMVVAGSTRSDDNVPVQERTGVVLVPFPEDGVRTSFPPFAWQE